MKKGHTTEEWLNLAKNLYKEREIEKKELDKQTKNGLPSNRIKFLSFGNLYCEPKSEWIKAILDYLDEIHNNKVKYSL